MNPDVIILCLSSLVNGLIIVNIFPYVGYMVIKSFDNNDNDIDQNNDNGNNDIDNDNNDTIINDDNVGKYVGYVSFSFMFGRTVTSYYWGYISDIYGRIIVLQVSLVLSSIGLIWFGLSTTFTSIILSRFFLGSINSLTSITKVLASEIGSRSRSRSSNSNSTNKNNNDNDDNDDDKNKVNNNKEKQIMGLIVGMRSWGFLLGPAIGGLLSDPIKQYPNYFITTSTTTDDDTSSQSLSQSSSLCYKIFEKYPYIMPNFIIAILCLVCGILTPIFIKETLVVVVTIPKPTTTTRTRTTNNDYFTKKIRNYLCSSKLLLFFNDNNNKDIITTSSCCISMRRRRRRCLATREGGGGGAYYFCCWWWKGNSTKIKINKETNTATTTTTTTTTTTGQQVVPNEETTLLLLGNGCNSNSNRSSNCNNNEIVNVNAINNSNDHHHRHHHHSKEDDNSNNNDNDDNNFNHEMVVVKEDEQQQQQQQESSSSSSFISIFWNYYPNNTKRHMICTWIFGFVVTMIDESFPLYCISKNGGLNLDEKSIGQILSLSGLIFVLGQYVTYIRCTNYFGIYRSIEIGCFIGLILTSFIPISLVFDNSFSSSSVYEEEEEDDNDNDDKNKNNNWIWTLLFLGILLGISKIMICMCFASLAIATNGTVTQNQRGTLNGYVMIGSSIAKGCGPIFAGILSSMSFSILSSPYGAIAIFTCIGIILGLPTFTAMKHLHSQKQ